jgi:SAM-dependent methyltransferase
LTGQRNLPPLWLRRQAGPPDRFESAAREMSTLLERLRLVEPDDCVLDIGCGAGAMVPAFSSWLGPRGRYTGIDIHGPSIRWCRRKFGRDPRFRFERVGRSRGGRLPVRDAEAGFVLAKSLFTHLLEEDARRLLEEVRRTLAPGGAALITAFLFERGEGERLCADYFPHTGGSGSVRWRWRARPESAVAIERPRFLQWIAQAELDVERFIPGFWPGAAEPGGQDVIVLSNGTARRTALPCSRNRVAPKTL